MNRRPFALLLTAALAGFGLAAVTVLPTAASAAAPDYTFVSLGAKFAPHGVNSDNVVVGDLDTGGAYAQAEVWHAGTLTALPGDGVHAFGIGDQGVVVGQGADSKPRIWPSTTASPGVGGFVGTETSFDEATGSSGWVSYGDGAGAATGVIAGATGSVSHTIGAGQAAVGLSKTLFLGRDTSDGVHDKRYLGVVATGAHQADLPGTAFGMASDGALIEGAQVDGGTVDETAVRLVDGSVVQRPIRGGFFINAQHDLASFGAVLPAGESTPLTIGSLLPEGWTNGQVSGLGDNGSVIGTAIDPSGHYGGFLLTTEPKVSGKVYGVSCGEATCSRGGLGSVDVLIIGTTSAGDPLSKTVTTKANGAWSATVPKGTYDIGPTVDGTTFVGPAFDPSQAHVKVTSGGKSGLDFQTCAHAGKSSASSTHALGRAAAESSAPSFCQSIYTVTLDAQLPKGRIVDPSTAARFNRNHNPDVKDYRDSTSEVDALLHTAAFTNGIAGVRRQYPACMSDSEIADLDEQKVHVEWYSYIEGGGSLGKMHVTLAWNQDKDVQTVRVVGQPSVTLPEVTKVWVWRYEHGGKTYRDSCKQTVEADPLIVPIAGGEPGASGLKKNQFALMIAWEFPFTSSGVMAGNETGAAAIVKKFGRLGQKLYRAYSSLTERQRFFLDFTIGLAIGARYVHNVELAAKLISRFAPELADYLPGLAGITAENLHRVLAVRELANFVAGYADEYPVMGAIVRGSFTTWYVEHNDHKTPFVEGTIVGLNVHATEFPDITLHVRRDAEDATFGNPVFSHKDLPWKTLRASNVIRVNPYDKNAPYYISNPSASHAHYSSGAHAVHLIKEQTENVNGLEKLAASAKQEATPVAEYKDALAPVVTPGCGTDGDAGEDPAHTICYYLKDGRA